MMNSDNWRNNTDRYRLIVDSSFKYKTTISYGLIVYAKNTKRFLLVCRKHSIDFLLFIKGCYRKTTLPFILNKITPDEAKIIPFLNDESEFYKYFVEELGFDKEDFDYAYSRYLENLDCAKNIIYSYNLENNKLSWGWPKGRLNISPKETPFSCALREFKEEVGVNVPPFIYKSDKFYIDRIKTFFGRIIESRYWIYIIENEFPLSNVELTNKEISNRQWFTYEECKNILSNPNILIENENIFK